jgi:hypothetical protein
VVSGRFCPPAVRCPLPGVVPGRGLAGVPVRDAAGRVAPGRAEGDAGRDVPGRGAPVPVAGRETPPGRGVPVLVGEPEVPAGRVALPEPGERGAAGRGEGVAGFAVELPARGFGVGAGESAGLLFTSPALLSGASFVGFNSSAIPSSLEQVSAHERSAGRRLRAA